MASTEHRMPIQPLMKNITLTVRITDHHGYAVRQWIAVRLIRCAAALLGMRHDISFEGVKHAD